jgi:hypothetical protein
MNLFNYIKKEALDSYCNVYYDVTMNVRCGGLNVGDYVTQCCMDLKTCTIEFALFEGDIGKVWVSDLFGEYLYGYTVRDSEFDPMV